jgi:hypothetical protein
MHPGKPPYVESAVHHALQVAWKAWKEHQGDHEVRAELARAMLHLGAALEIVKRRDGDGSEPRQAGTGDWAKAMLPRRR